MKRCGILSWFALLTVFAGICALADEPDAAKKAIQKLLDDQDAAWNKGDLEGFMAGYWKSDELTFFSGKDVTKGWNATLERYKKRYQYEGKDMGKLTLSELNINALGPQGEC